jgi:nucleotide-binding universal stress UspA family protein
MVTRVLVAMDDSEMAANALRYALDVHPEADITVLTVVGGPSVMMGEATSIAMADDPRAEAERHAEPVLERAREIAAEAGVEIQTAVRVGAPSREIVNFAEDFDVVTLGSHGGSMADRLLVGNVAKRVFNHSPAPVTVVR